MPIVYLHGVAIREPSVVASTITAHLENFVAPALVGGHAGAASHGRIFSAYWGNDAVQFAWNHASLPDAVADGENEDPFLALAIRLLKERSSRMGDTDVRAPLPVQSGDQLSSVLATALKDIDASNVAKADDHALFASKIFMRWRPAINAILSQFFGDIFVYLSRRGDADAPGPIVTDFLDVLLQASEAHPGEPLIVLSHSMGGQIVYDCVTYYMPRIKKYSKLRIHLWASTGSQVALFEEMKLFKASDDAIRAPDKVDVDRTHLIQWYNVWDPNDLLSYTAQPVFNDVDDENFNSNLPIPTAHFGYLVAPAFYARLAEKVRAVIRSA